MLAELFADLGPVAASGFDWLREPVDLIINATSASLSGDVPPIAPSLVEPDSAAVALDGLGMLAEQAAEAFELWRGVRPDTAPVLAELRRLSRRFGAPTSPAPTRGGVVQGNSGVSGESAQSSKRIGHLSTPSSFTNSSTTCARAFLNVRLRPSRASRRASWCSISTPE